MSEEVLKEILSELQEIKNVVENNIDRKDR